MSDLFGFLKEMNKGNYRYIDTMSEDETKKISPFVLLMWCNGAESAPEVHTVLTDTYVNEYVFSLAKHPKLLHKLFFAANEGMGNTRYKFKKTATKDDMKQLKAICYYHQCSEREARDYMKILTKSDLKHLLDIYEEVEK